MKRGILSPAFELPLREQDDHKMDEEIKWTEQGRLFLQYSRLCSLDKEECGVVLRSSAADCPCKSKLNSRNEEAALKFAKTIIEDLIAKYPSSSDGDVVAELPAQTSSELTAHAHLAILVRETEKKLILRSLNTLDLALAQKS